MAAHRVVSITVLAVVVLGTVTGFAVDRWNGSVGPDRIIVNPTTDPATSFTVTWRTDEGTSDGTLEIAPADSPDVVTTVEANDSVIERLPGSSLSARHHSATAADLEPDTAYTYRVGTGTHWSSWATVRTAPVAGSPWTFLYFGDAQWSLDGTWADVADRAFTQVPDASLALTAGDLVNDGNDDGQWKQWFASLDGHTTTCTFLTVPGNHEMYGDAEMIRYRSHIEYPDNGPDGQEDLAYYVDYGGVRFITLNGNITDSVNDPVDNGLGALQAEWLEGVLADNPQQWTVVTIHQPMFSAAKLRDNAAQKNAFMPLLESYGVDLVFQGHDHAYARGHLEANDLAGGGYTGPTYVVANAGGKYYDLDPANRNNWTMNGAVRDAAADKISTYQSVEVSGDRLVYTSWVGAVGGPNPSPAEAKPGDVVDTFTVTKDASGRPVVTAD